MKTLIKQLLCFVASCISSVVELQDWGAFANNFWLHLVANLVILTYVENEYLYNVSPLFFS